MKSSPHIEKYNGNSKIIIADSFSRILNSFSKRKVYKENNSKKDGIHNGQRKLLMTEVEFLTNFINENPEEKNLIVVYIGASTGATQSVHTYTLIRMFPEFEYHLYDQYSFYDKLYKLDNVKIFKRWFNDSDSKLYRNRKTLLISDMRNPSIGDTLRSADNIIFSDMNIQMKFYKDINPLSALLKFRLPWKPGKTKYLGGTLYYQVWEGAHSTETRLVPNGKMKIYDNTDYEEKLYYFNTEVRYKYYKHNYDCYCHCFDCMSEVTILKSYIKLKKSGLKLCEIGRKITKELTIFNSDKRLFETGPLSEFGI